MGINMPQGGGMQREQILPVAGSSRHADTRYRYDGGVSKLRDLCAGDR